MHLPRHARESQPPTDMACHSDGRGSVDFREREEPLRARAGALDVLPFNHLLQSGRPDSNRRRPAWEAGILPTELRPRTTDRAAEPSIAKLPPLRRSATPPHDREPQVRIELTTARLRIGCSTTELLWRREDALARTRTATPFGTTPSRWRVYQFHHQGMLARYGTFSCAAPPSCVLLGLAGSCTCTGPTGLEPATSRVTVECSNQTELRPLNSRYHARRCPAEPSRSRHHSRHPPIVLHPAEQLSLLVLRFTLHHTLLARPPAPRRPIRRR